MLGVDYSKDTPPPDYRCSNCGAHGVKLWRGYMTIPVELLCARCAGRLKGVSLWTMMCDGTRIGEHGQRTDQIGGLVPAIPDEEGLGYWGYFAITMPKTAREWWERLPNAIAEKEGMT